MGALRAFGAGKLFPIQRVMMRNDTAPNSKAIFSGGYPGGRRPPSSGLDKRPAQKFGALYPI